MSDSVLVMQGIEKRYGKKDSGELVLKGINARFLQGETYAIKGVSGSGKSTMLHVLGGLDLPSGGRVLFDDVNINELKRSQKERFLNRKIGFVFQFHYLIRELSVLENVMVPGLIAGDNYAACKKKGLFLLEELGLEDKKDRYPFELSGGEQQRVSIIRSIFNKPKFILADEPTGNLDAKNAEHVINLLLRCREEWNLGLIICSHDKAVYDAMNVVYELKEGVLSSAMQS